MGNFVILSGIFYIFRSERLSASIKLTLHKTLIRRSVTVAERYKVRTVFARSEAGIVGSNLTQGTDV
jgi:hypothetical protein